MRVTRAAVEDFARDHGWPVVLKASRGGYDGRGVWPVDGPDQLRPVIEGAGASGTRLLVEARVPLRAELAVLVARGPGGATAVWPAVETAQVDGVCREVLVPGRLDPAVEDRARQLGRRVAEVTGSVGVLAVELFWDGVDLVVNEVAARPHNSGHWTIEGAVTSQFENHLRAVLDLPLGPRRWPRRRWPASTSSVGPTGPTRPPGWAVPWRCPAPTCTCMANDPARDANWAT